jgi:hypothetical protein
MGAECYIAQAGEEIATTGLSFASCVRGGQVILATLCCSYRRSGRNNEYYFKPAQFYTANKTVLQIKKMALGVH